MIPVQILLVEDSPEDAELTLRALRRRNVSNAIKHVEDGEEALEFLLDEGTPPPRVVLLDLKLPRVDGLEVLEQMRAAPRARDIPVVILTSSKEDRDLHRAYELGANSYIVKPVEFDDFVDTVGNLGFYWMLVNEPPL